MVLREVLQRFRVDIELPSGVNGHQLACVSQITYQLKNPPGTGITGNQLTSVSLIADLTLSLILYLYAKQGLHQVNPVIMLTQSMKKTLHLMLNLIALI